MPRPRRPYINPYYAGVGIGLVLLASYALVGRGLGASGAFSSVVTSAVNGAAPQHAAANPSYERYLGGALLGDWLVLELIGVTMGALLSAWHAGRLRITLERGDGTSPRSRIVTALAGGLLMGVGAKLARGCTSGQALTGGALLATGSWVFIGACFIAAYAAAPFLRRQWQ
jgi:uncharacterized membrane protein YedE/YeeE